MASSVMDGVFLSPGGGGGGYFTTQSESTLHSVEW
jgi:hypothetical protein